MHENAEESSITSDFSSSVGIHRTPSNGFEDYTKRREIFLARIGGGQPQDFTLTHSLEKKEPTPEDRKNLEAYEERKRAKEEQDRLFAQRIRLERR